MCILIFPNKRNTFKPCQIEEFMLILRDHNFTLCNLLDFALNNELPQQVLVVSVNNSKLFDQEPSHLALKVVSDSIVSVLSLTHNFSFSEVQIMFVPLSCCVNLADSANLDVSCRWSDVFDVQRSWIARE
jgi:hypothetical protein